MKYSFDTTIAKEVGVEEAVMLENIYYWIIKNKANNKHFYDGNYWTYNSIQAFEDLFPFWSKKQITRILKKLEVNNFILTGNYNKISYDRTKWYSLTKKALCIFLNGQMEIAEWENGKDQKDKPIPNINTDINTNINTDIYITSWNSLGLNKLVSIKKGSIRYKELNARINEYGEDKVLAAIELINKSNFLKGDNHRNWSATFDWTIKANNFIKVLEGNYTDKDKSKTTKKPVTKFDNFEGREYDYDNLEKKLLGWD